MDLPHGHTYSQVSDDRDMTVTRMGFLFDADGNAIMGTEYGGRHPGVDLAGSVITAGGIIGAARALRPAETNVEGSSASAAGGEASATGGDASATAEGGAGGSASSSSANTNVNSNVNTNTAISSSSASSSSKSLGVGVGFGGAGGDGGGGDNCFPPGLCR